MPSRQFTLWRDYACYFRAHRALLAGIAAAGGLQSCAYLPLAVLLRRTLDGVLPSALSALVLFSILFRTQPALARIIGVSAPAMFVANRLMVRRVWFQQKRLRQAFEAFSRGVPFAISALERRDRNLGRLPFRPAVIVVSHEWRMSEGRLVETAPEVRP